MVSVGRALTTLVVGVATLLVFVRGGSSLPTVVPAAASGSGGGTAGAASPTLVYAKGGALWLARADGSERRLLVDDDPVHQLGFQLAWSPDGARLVFTRYGYAPGPWDARVFLVDVDSGRTVVAVDDALEPVVRWAPDSASLVVHMVGTGDPATNPITAVARYDVARSALEHIILPEVAQQWVCASVWHISTDTQWLAYLARDGTLRMRQLATGQERNLGTPPPTLARGAQPDLCYRVAWSPDSAWFAWVRNVSDSAASNMPTHEVYVLRREAQSVAEAVRLATVHGGRKCCQWAWWYQPLVWSPDGAWLTYWYSEAGPLPAPGYASGAAQSPPGGWPGVGPCPAPERPCLGQQTTGYHWSPDGQWFVYVARHPVGTLAVNFAPESLRLARTDGTVDLELAPAMELAPAEWMAAGAPYPYQGWRLLDLHLTNLFSADSRYLYYLTYGGELWTFEIATGQRTHLDDLAAACSGCATSLPAWRP